MGDTSGIHFRRSFDICAKSPVAMLAERMAAYSDA